MTFLAKLISDSLCGVDPRIFFVPICFGLGACFILVLADLEKTRMRWIESARMGRAQASRSTANEDQKSENGEARRPKQPTRPRS